MRTKNLISFFKTLSKWDSDLSLHGHSVKVSYPFPKQALVFTCWQYKSLENTEGKGEIAHNEQFLLFPQCFLPFWRTFFHFHQV